MYVYILNMILSSIYNVLQCGMVCKNIFNLVYKSKSQSLMTFPNLFFIYTRITAK